MPGLRSSAPPSRPLGTGGVRWPFSSRAGGLNIVEAEGCILHTHDGRAILDAAGGAIAVNVGHGRTRIADAVRAATLHRSYVVPPWLTPERERLLARLAEHWLPPELSRVHLADSGSAGVETAIKIAIQYQAARGRPEKSKIVARTPSYHGTTLMAAALGGHEVRRRGLDHALPACPQVPAPYPLRCPAEDVAGYCLEALEATLLREGPETVAAFLAEPIVGASGGALVPPPSYWPGVRALCDRYDVLLLADEVMIGFGRTGLRFGYQHWSGVPDVLVAGKGLASGYAPLTGVFATETIGAAIDGAGWNVMFHTFGAHPAACAAADEVLAILDEEGLVARAAKLGEQLRARLLAALADHPHVAEVRGAGLLQAVEIVQDRSTLSPYPEAAGMAGRVAAAALRHGVWFYAGGTGPVRDIVMLGPPFTISEAQLEQIAAALAAAIDEATAQ